MRDYKTARSRGTKTASGRKKSRRKPATASRKRAPRQRSQKKKTPVKKVLTSNNQGRVQKWLFGFGTTVAVILFGLYFLSLNISALFPLKSVQTVVLADSDPSKHSSLYLVSFIPDVGQIVVHELPAEEMVDVVGGYGEYKLEALDGLMALEEKDDEYVLAAYSLATGKLIEGTLSAKIVTIEEKEQLEKMLFDLLRQRSPADDIEGALSFGEILSLYAFTREPGTKIVFGTDNVNPLANYVSEASERCSVAVINTTEISGLATKVGEILSESGLSVVRTAGDTTEQPATSMVYLDTSNPECEHWAQYAGSVLPNYSDAIVKDANKATYFRASIVLVLGEDME